jgi:Ca2+/H+ antiporter, TMEM165/GDT1 family
MTGLLLALLGAAIAGLGARDQNLMARLAATQGARPSALVIALAISFATAAFAAWAGSTIAPIMPAKARLLLAWLALVLAGVEMLVIVPGKAPKEPTNSLGALAIVLAAHQITDAARFLTFAIAVMAAAPMPAGIGGAVGGAVSLTAAWMAPELFGNPRVRLWRRLAGIALLVLAAVLILPLLRRL